MEEFFVVVFVDFNCGLCNRIVRKLQNLDEKKIFFFSPIGGKTWESFHIKNPKDSVLVVQNNGFYWEFAAVRVILRNLPFPWWGIGAFCYVIPNALGNFVYRWVAKRRKSLSICSIPVSVYTVLPQRFLPIFLLGWIRFVG